MHEDVNLLGPCGCNNKGFSTDRIILINKLSTKLVVTVEERSDGAESQRPEYTEITFAWQPEEPNAGSNP